MGTRHMGRRHMQAQPMLLQRYQRRAACHHRELYARLLRQSRTDPAAYGACAVNTNFGKRHCW
jgi:hypothetical protein